MHKSKNLIVSLCLFSLCVAAQSNCTSAKKKWYNPSGILVEYAGGFGMFSVGTFFNLSKKTEITVNAGYTPPAYGNIFTLNFLPSYKPFTFSIGKNILFTPVTIGVFANFNFGKNIYLFWPTKYPDEDYYWWNSALRFGPFVNAELEHLPKKGKYNYSLFFQCSTNDLYISSYYGNRSTIYLHQILVYGIGVKLSHKKK